MSYLTTILTYNIPSEAEVDKSLLESHGLAVNLLNANVSRSEIGAPFNIALQVPTEHAAEAIAILKEFCPGRFGSADVVKKIEVGIRKAIVRYVFISLGCSLLLLLFVLRQSSLGERIIFALILGFLFGALCSIMYALIKQKPSKQG